MANASDEYFLGPAPGGDEHRRLHEEGAFFAHEIDSATAMLKDDCGRHKCELRLRAYSYRHVLPDGRVVSLPEPPQGVWDSTYEMVRQIRERRRQELERRGA